MKKLKEIIDTILMFLGLKDIKPKKPREDWEQQYQDKAIEEAVDEMVAEHVANVNVETSSPHPYGQHDNGYAEPPTTGMIGTITSFLWKPQSDHGEHAAVLVSCDEVPTNQLFMEVLNAKGNVMRSVDSKAFSRGNKLDTQKFARISFRVAVPMKQLSKAAPLGIRFFQVVDGKKHILSVKNRPKLISIKDPTQRIEWR